MAPLPTLPEHQTDDPVRIRKLLVSNGFWPVPIKGKRPRITGWTTFRPELHQIEGQARSHADHPGTGIICGEVVAIDIDAPDAEAAAHLTAMADRLPGADRALRRVGRAPKLLLMFRATEVRKKISTAEYLVGEHKCQVEILGSGQQFAAFGIHPDTGMPYQWLTQSPIDVHFEDLPETTPESIDAFVAEAEAYLKSVGTPLKAPKAETRPQRSGGTFWQQVNAAALAAPEKWVRDLFPSASKEAGTGAWRVSSKDLGRALEEDISIHSDGVQDFGLEKPTTPIQLVVDYGGAPSPKDAAHWICEKLGIDPADLGWEVRAAMPGMTLGSLSKTPKADNDNEPDPDDDDITDAGSLAEDAGFPAALCYPPGAVGRFTRFIESCSRFPSPHLSLAAALALTAGLIGRRYKGPTGLRSNLYIIGLAESGVGKDITIRASAALADSTSAGTAVSEKLFMDEIRSVPGLAARLRKSPSAVAVIDEFGKWLGQHTSRTAAGYKEEIVTAILALTGAPSGFWGGQEKGTGNVPRVIAPCFSIHGISTPTTFWQALSSGNISEGLLGRFVLVDAGREEPKKVRRPAGSLDDIPAELVDDVHALLGGGNGQCGGGPFYAISASSETKPWPVMPVEYAPGVEDLFEEFDDAMRARKKTFAPEYRPLLNRVGENAARLAMIVAVGVNPKEPVITMEMQTWANTAAEHSFRAIVSGADDNVADNEKAGEYLRLKRMVRKPGARGITRKMLLKNVRGSLDMRRFDDITIQLQETGEIYFAKVRAESGQTMTRFWSKEHLPEGASVIPPGT